MSLIGLPHLENSDIAPDGVTLIQPAFTIKYDDPDCLGYDAARWNPEEGWRQP